MASGVLERNGQAAGLECFEISGFSFNEAGEARIEAAGKAKRILQADMVILAVGVKPELDFLKGAGIELNPNGTIKIDKATMATSTKRVFAAGDVATGPSIVASAVGQGREAALAVHRFLTGVPKAHEILAVGENSQIRREPVGLEGKAHVVTFSEMFNPEYYPRRPAKRAASPHGFLSQRETPVSTDPRSWRPNAAFTAATATSAASAWRTAPASSS